MRIGIFVGSFNPVHEGHIHVANYLLNNNYVDKMLIIPTMPYWDKKDFASLEDRINMLKYYENEDIIIDSTHNSYPYTYMLMEELLKEYPNDELYLIIGADNILEFKKWRNYQELLKNKIIVINRNNIDINHYINEYEEKDNFIVINDFDYIDVSSTRIKNDLDDEYLHPLVYQYIKEHNLYGKKNIK